MTKPFYIDWSQQPEGYPLWLQDLKPEIGFDASGWFHEKEAEHFVRQDGELWRKKSEGTSFTVHRRPKGNWHENGELPPVGERVLMVGNEYSSLLSVTDAARFNDHLGQEVKIVAHSVTPLTNTPIAVYEVSVQTDTRYGYDYHAMVASCFKPIPTEEEKAEAQKKDFETQLRVDLRQFWSGELQPIIDGLYHMGYRKQEDAE